VTNPNWSLMGGNNALAMFQFGANLGQQARASQEERALKEAVGAYATNPNDPNALASVMKLDPKIGLQFQKQNVDIAAKRQEAQRGRVKEIARLFDGVTPENYGQRIAAAQSLGIDVAGVPQQFDPAWVAQNKAIFDAFADDDGQRLSGLARELVDAGYQPNTPGFNKAMREVISNKYASEYVDEYGNTRRRSLLDLNANEPSQQPAPPQPNSSQIEAPTFDQYQGAVNGLGADGAAAWLRRHNLAVRVTTPQQAASLPRGTRLILPDGTEGVVP
jgi:hypothetical protein